MNAIAPLEAVLHEDYAHRQSALGFGRVRFEDAQLGQQKCPVEGDLVDAIIAAAGAAVPAVHVCIKDERIAVGFQGTQFRNIRSEERRVGKEC